jgi:hypothetical protein
MAEFFNGIRHEREFGVRRFDRAFRGKLPLAPRHAKKR